MSSFYCAYYRIKEIKVIMHKAERKIVFVKNDVKKEVPFEDLDKNPTGVFKVLMGIKSDGIP
ncbi:hypothetical protein SAMN05444673_3427 [Bacillus sp. OV166]|nr:hypothetical protein SAMN05444673_3427 [Bacillus sp. OV166]